MSTADPAPDADPTPDVGPPPGAWVMFYAGLAGIVLAATAFVYAFGGLGGVALWVLLLFLAAAAVILA